MQIPNDVKYKNSPIVEVVCNLIVPQEIQWDVTIPGEIYKNIKDEFPNKESKIVQQIDFKVERQSIIQRMQSSERGCFYKNNRKDRIIQVGKNIVTVNHLKPYEGWQEYKKDVATCVKGLSKALPGNKCKFQWATLKYVNEITVYAQKFDIEEYFKFVPNIPDELPQNIAGFIIGCDFIFENGDCLCKTTLMQRPEQIKKERESGKTVFILDIDYYTAVQEIVNTDNIYDWLETAHNNIKTVFEGSITNKSRKIFNDIE